MNVICGIMDQCDTQVDFIIVCRSVTYISWSNDFFSTPEPLGSLVSL